MARVVQRAICRARASESAFFVASPDVKAFEALLDEADRWAREAVALLPIASTLGLSPSAQAEDRAERALLLLAVALQKARDAQRLAVHVPNHHQGVA